MQTELDLEMRKWPQDQDLFSNANFSVTAQRMEDEAPAKRRKLAGDSSADIETRFKVSENRSVSCNFYSNHCL